MGIRAFIKLVEIPTKVASMIPFLFGTLYALFRFQEFDGYHFALMLVSLLSFDMATTALNNYYDYKKAIKKHGFGYEEHNAIVRYNMKEPAVVSVILVLILTAVGAGLLLFLSTGWLILLLGGMSFAVGILYSFGPIPISRMPLGELFSGLFMGFVIIFISTWIHVADSHLAVLALHGGVLSLQVNLPEVLLLLVVSMPAILGIANIMLANNICDMEEDLENKRYTLPVYIGFRPSLKLFRLLYFLAYLDLAALLLMKVHPVLIMLVLITLAPVYKKSAIFTADPSKKRTFVIAVQNFVFMNVARIVALAVTVAWTSPTLF
ncbi:1,4-dihydroxy-2-naphthoate polyprenyltransferase [Paenibacillus campinasensis]|uniref:1,4-dihydroxy-2-naphthoate polyprenyltransferase n=1 Tax=Paenibacillus campinasensis TaxID=66347 RepID=A0A268F2X8_9BACL|nr:1,4-dihydroxy-2-naphthoate polyprenyltransferase [Paenibacillus campinasensis]PAD79711.1 1,4-dihydroxy-2-naphthoate polyprenyltransferase [Paenibacillus campinasensis]